MYFRRGSILESPGSMVQFGEFLITVDPVQLNTTKQDQQDPKTTFMRCHLHARARHCLGVPSNCFTGWRGGTGCLAMWPCTHSMGSRVSPPRFFKYELHLHA